MANPNRANFDQNRQPVIAAIDDGNTGNIYPLEYNVATGGLDVNIVGGGGSGGTASTFGSPFPSVGTAAGASNGTTMQPLLVDGSGYLEVNVKAGSGSGLSVVDEASFTAGTSQFVPSGGVFNDSATALTSGQQGTERLTPNRGIHVNLRTNSGSELVTATGASVPANAFYIGMVNTSGNLVGLSAGGNFTDASGMTAQLANGNYVYNGTNWDRERSANGASNTTGTGLLGTGTMMFDGTNWQKVSTTNPLPTSTTSLPLPTGASTSALQTTGNTSLSTIATNTTGLATSANQTSGSQKTQVVDGSDVTIPSTTTASVNGNTVGLNANIVASGVDYYPGYNSYAAGQNKLQVDPGGSLQTRGPTMTDEGSFRVNFTNSSLYVTSSFNGTFSNGGYTVTFASSIAGILEFGSFIALSSDGAAAATIVAEVLNSTTVVLGTGYPGSSATGTFIYGNVGSSVGTGGSITVASGQATMATGTTTGSMTYLYGPVDIPTSYFIESSFSLSQREANQDIYLGFEASPFATITQFARFHFTGTSNTTVITETGYNPTSAPSSSEQETNTINLSLLNNSPTTATLQTYRMIVEVDKIFFFINGNLVATHTRRLPRAKDFLYQGATYGLRTQNGTSPSTSTNVVTDYIFLRAYDRLDTNILTTAASANGANNSTTGNLIGAGIFGQYNSSLPTVTSGNYYLAQLDSSGRQLVNVGAGTIGTTSAVVNVGQQTVSTTAVQISSSSTVPTNGILIGALSTNSASIFIGGSGVTTSNGVEILPGGAQPFTCNLNTLYIISAASTTDKVWWNVS